MWRWLVLIVCSLSLLGCGGLSNQNLEDEIEEDFIKSRELISDIKVENELKNENLEEEEDNVVNTIETKEENFRTPVERDVDSVNEDILDENRNEETVIKDELQVTLPVPFFFENITLKRYGSYITPQTSPVQPERFQGFHTGVDIEVTENSDVIPVVAIAEGTVLLSRYVNGYGGVVIIEHVIEDKTYSVLYGHLKSSSLTQNKIVQKGEQIGVLGKGYTAETDGERQHLHFGVKEGKNTDLRGYVQTEKELEGWLDGAFLLQEWLK